MENSRDYSQFKGKRLLLLGGHSLTIHVIEQCRKMGIYTIVTDNVKGSPAKAVADESYDVSTLDIDALVKLAKDVRADGVFTGYVDINLAPCRKVCEILGFPFYATLEQLDETMNKVNFKNNCRKHGIRVAEDVPAEYLDGDYGKIQYPVIVKPADSYSSKGISVCHRKEEMQEALDKAMSFSTCGQVVAEEYIEAPDVYLYFTVQDGYVSLSAMADRLLNDEQYGCAPQPVGYFFPSKNIDIYFDKVDAKLKEMMADLGIRNGSFFMQGFVVDRDIIFFEMGLRLSGGAGYLQIARQNEINQVEMHIRYALTGKFDGWDLKTCDNPRFKNPACVLVVLLKDGKITELKGVEEIMQHEDVFNILQFKHCGDVLDARGTLNQVFARIYLEGKDEEQLKETITFIKRTLVIRDENGENMILNLFDENQIY